MMILPSRTALFACWALLMTMTGLSLWAGDPTGSGRLPLYAVTVLLAASGVKAVQILWLFLNLRQSTTTWKTIFVAFLLAIFAVVFACAGVSAYLGR